MSNKVQLKNLEVDGKVVSNTTYTVDLDWSSEEFEKRTSRYSPGLRIAIRKRFIMLKAQEARLKIDQSIESSMHHFKQMTESTKLNIIYEFLIREKFERQAG